MPKIIPAEWKRELAIFCLLELYEGEAQFVAEWRRLRVPYLSPLTELASVSGLYEVYRFRSILPFTWENVHKSYLVEEHLIKRSSFFRGSRPSLDELEERYEQLRENLVPYTTQLTSLAYHWNLRASWAGDELLDEDVESIVSQLFKEAGVHEFGDLVAEEVIKHSWELMPSSASKDVYPLTVRIGPVDFMLQGRRETLMRLRKTLADYEKGLRYAGFGDFPSAVKRHAKWWFEHYVDRKTYAELETQFAQAGQETIKRKVWEFSRLVGIKTR
jgi:hypothetical protein